jgi:hypothetical protein
MTATLARIMKGDVQQLSIEEDDYGQNYASHCQYRKGVLYADKQDASKQKAEQVKREPS